MNKQKIILIVGVIVMFMPISGFPREIKNPVLYICGMIIVATAILDLRKKYKDSKSKINNDTYEESRPSENSEKNNVSYS